MAKGKPISSDPVKMGRSVRRARRALDISQTDLARRAGCSQVTISRVERRWAPAADLARRILDALASFEAERAAR